mgnify:CR=1 FL=1
MNILIVKIGAIGDVVMALPMVEAIYKQSLNAKITWMCGKTAAPLLKSIERINEVIVIDESKLLTGKITEKITVLFHAWKNLLFRKFDLIVTGHAHPGYKSLTLTAIGNKRRGFIRNAGRQWPVPGRYHGDEYVRLITNIDGPETFPAELPQFNPPLTDDLKRLLPSDNSHAVAFAPGGARNILSDDEIRRWPLENYVALARKLIGNGIKVIITGAESDRWICKDFSGIGVYDLVGKTSLLELISVYKESKAAVTHDSGLLHLAQLAGTNVIALFGPTNPYEKIPRSLNRREILWGGEDMACRPCYDGRNYAYCTDNICLRTVSVEMVFQAVLRALQG